jgi:hypothetical protein
MERKTEEGRAKGKYNLHIKFGAALGSNKVLQVKI